MTTNFGGRDTASAVAFDPVGRIVAAGSTRPPGGSSFRFALARYFSFGAPDPNFDDDGKVVTGIEDEAVARDVAVQADGKIVAAGERDGGLFGNSFDFTVVRYNVDGSLDSSFDGNGIRVDTFKLKPRRKRDEHQIRRLLRGGKTLRARVRLKLVDDAGNRVVLKRTIKLTAKRGKGKT